MASNSKHGRLDKVFVSSERILKPAHLIWALNHFRSQNTMIILTSYIGTSIFDRYFWAFDRTFDTSDYVSRCTERKFKVKRQRLQTQELKQAILQLVTEHGMKKFVTYADTNTQRQISEFFEENPDLSCKIWFVDTDGLLVKVRDQRFDPNSSGTDEDDDDDDDDYSVTTEDILQEEIEKLKQENEELRNGSNNIPNRSHPILSSEFRLRELKQATQNFSDSLKLGEGGFGAVYKGTLHRMPVAIKILDPKSLQGVSQFKQEVAVLSQIRHPHLVTLIGSCSEASALVYEFLSNGSLQDRLTCTNNTPPLTWQIRTRIIGEICLALIFLHSCKPHLVIHGDLNPNNILLDAKLVSKLADFGISRVVKRPDNNSTALHQTLHPAGTYAYTDPEYTASGELTPKSDVYSLGIIILRVLTGTVPLGIVKRVDEALKHGSFQSMIDGSAGDWPLDQAKKLAEIGLSCAEISRKSRPNLVTGVWSVIEPLMKAASLSVDENQIPNHFICPILQDVMKDPHLAADGFTYEAEAIKRWINSGHNKSPMTNLVLSNRNLIPNHVLRSAIQEWLEHHRSQH